jgi:hypothetical protein
LPWPELPFRVELVPEANGFRLPTELQWEYAGRANATTRYTFGDEWTLFDWPIGDLYCVTKESSEGNVGAVGSRYCNAWGLFDMYGNVREWCWESVYEPYWGNGELVQGVDFRRRYGSSLISGNPRPGTISRSVPHKEYFGFRVAVAPSASGPLKEPATHAATTAQLEAEIERILGWYYMRDGRLFVELHGPKINDDWLPNLQALPHVPTTLDLEQSRITDAGLQHLGNLANVTSLSLKRTNVTGVGFRHLHGWSQLESLDLEQSRVTDDGLQHLAGLTGLTSLSLKRTNLSGKGFRHLHTLSNLASLELNESLITDDGLQYLKMLASLKKLNLEKTKIGDEGLRHLASVPNLRSIALHETPISDAGLLHLKECTTLETLYLKSPGITWDAVSELMKSLPDLKAWYVGSR